MMFYDILAKFYDIIFPKNFTILNFLNSYIINQPSNILDIACGTGNYSLSLAEKGHNVYGIDNNPKMIEQAISKALFSSIIITFDVFDMMQLNLYNIQIFDLIFCIGNSIAHIKSIEQLNNFFTNVYNKLKSGGTFILHTINYQNSKLFEKSFFPIIENNNIKFIRWYEPTNGLDKISFNAKLILNGKEEHNIKNELLKIDIQQIYHDLQNLFTKVEIYSDYQKSPYSMTANSAIFVCQK